MRLIDADLMIPNGFKDKIIEVRTEDIIESHEKVVKLLFRDALDFINKQPTVDAVKVVRCEDCEHWYPAVERDRAVNGLCYGFEFSLFVTPKDGFCFKGDKKSK